MTEIHYIDRLTKKEEIEEVYGGFFIRLLYAGGWMSKLLSFFLLVCKIPAFSRLYGALQKNRYSRKKIAPFIEKFHVDTSEFLEPVSAYASFNDFFIRKLKIDARPFVHGNDIAILPTDGRYLVYPNIHSSDGFFIKGKKFSLEALLQSKTLAHKYHQGSMVLARLCPTDYHRFHFPCNGIPEEPHLIKGDLYSVNPLALKKNIHIFTQNKRTLTQFHTKAFGTILYIEVGATCVGSIHQTFVPREHYAKGDEKGYFSFGGSSLVLIFEPFRIQFDQDLLEASQRRIEVRGLLGQSLGRALSPL